MSVQRHTLPDTVRELAKNRECFPVQQPMTAREFLARRGLQPLRIERTEKRPGDRILVGTHRAVLVA